MCLFTGTAIIYAECSGRILLLCYTKCNDTTRVDLCDQQVGQDQKPDEQILYTRTHASWFKSPQLLFYQSDTFLPRFRVRKIKNFKFFKLKFKYLFFTLKSQHILLLTECWTE